MKIQLRDLEYFTVVAELGNIGRAADKLNMSQPALSLSLRRLEQAANCKIVERISKGVQLTPAGAVLLQRVGKLQLAQEDVVREISDLGSGLTGQLRVGVTVGTHEYRMAIAGAKLRRASPAVTLTATLDSATTLLRALHKGEIDFLITTALANVPAGIVEERMGVERYVVYGSARHQLAARRKVAIADLANEQWAFSEDLGGMPRHLLHALAEHGLPAPMVAVRSNSIALRLQMIAESDLLGFASEWLIQHASGQFPLATIKVNGLNLQRQGVVMYREGGYLPPAARRFIELLKNGSSGKN